MKSLLVILQFVAILLTFWLDRLSKSWALAHLSGDTPMAFLPGIMQLHLTQNTGAAFSLGRENGQLMTLVATLVTIVLILWTGWRHRLHPNQMPLEKIGTGLLLGGAMGNLCDRFMCGQVTDFFQFTFIDFPIFNVADALIDVGIGLIIIDLLRTGRSVIEGPVPPAETEKPADASKSQPRTEQ